MHTGMDRQALLRSHAAADACNVRLVILAAWINQPLGTETSAVVLIQLHIEMFLVCKTDYISNLGKIYRFCVKESQQIEAAACQNITLGPSGPRSPQRCLDFLHPPPAK